jgi:hypothetical protein
MVAVKASMMVQLLSANQALEGGQGWGARLAPQGQGLACAALQGRVVSAQPASHTVSRRNLDPRIWSIDNRQDKCIVAASNNCHGVCNAQLYSTCIALHQTRPLGAQLHNSMNTVETIQALHPS